jgi:hypothetical protein
VAGHQIYLNTKNTRRLHYEKIKKGKKIQKDYSRHNVSTLGVHLFLWPGIIIYVSRRTEYSGAENAFWINDSGNRFVFNWVVLKPKSS